MSTLAIVGFGPNLGFAVARRFGAEGFDVGLVARDRERLDGLRGSLEGQGIGTVVAVADVREPGAVAAALGTFGRVDVLLYSPLPSLVWIKPVVDTTSEDLRPSLELSVLGAVDAVGAVLPGMLDRGAGTLLFTTGGAAVAPSERRASSAVSYAAEVSYARLLHEALTDKGVRVAHTAIVGALGGGLRHDPADIADVLWRQHADGGPFQTVCGP